MAKTPNQKAFEREIKRLERLVKIEENKGIIYLTSPIPETPKRITAKKLKQVQSISKRDIQLKGFTVNTETGEVIPYIPENRIQKQTKQKQQKPSAKTAEREAQIREQRLKNLEKAREALRKKRENEKRGKEESLDFTEEVKPQEKDIIETLREYGEEQPDDWQGTFDEFLPRQSDIIIENVKALLESGTNKNTCLYLLDLLNDLIDIEGYDTVAERLATYSESAIEMAQGVAFDSDGHEELADYAYSLADLITGGNMGGISAVIHDLAYEDLPYTSRRR